MFYVLAHYKAHLATKISFCDLIQSALIAASFTILNYAFINAVAYAF
jgi:hypothetical protein